MKSVEVEAMDRLATEVGRIASALFPPGNQLTEDNAGNFSGSLTEAVASAVDGLISIAVAIDNLAEAVREHGGGS